MYKTKTCKNMKSWVTKFPRSWRIVFLWVPTSSGYSKIHCNVERTLSFSWKYWRSPFLDHYRKSSLALERLVVAPIYSKFFLRPSTHVKEHQIWPVPLYLMHFMWIGVLSKFTERDILESVHTQVFLPLRALYFQNGWRIRREVVTRPVQMNWDLSKSVNTRFFPSKNWHSVNFFRFMATSSMMYGSELKRKLSAKRK